MMRGTNFRLHARMGRLGRRCAVLALAAALLLGGLSLWRQYDALLRDYADLWCGDLAARAVNAALYTELEGAGELSELVCDEEGRVTAIRVDAAEASRIKAATVLAISNHFEALTEQASGVPLGTVLGSRLLLGRGPQVHFRLTPVGNAQVELLSRFVEGGVNQTCHQLVLEAEVAVSVMLPGAVVYRRVAQEAIVSETVIVGEVPQVYLSAEQ